MEHEVLKGQTVQPKVWLLGCSESDIEFVCWYEYVIFLLQK